MTKYFLIGLIMPILMLENGFALVKYGDAFVKRGTLTIVREGKTIRYKKDYKTPVKVLKDDVLRAGRRSYVKLKTVQETTVFMGSNAVFQVRPWKQKKEQGFLRMLFGKARFQTTKTKAKRRRFSLKTAMAVIGVKGTKWEQATASNGAIDTKVDEGEVEVTPTNGPPVSLGIGQRSLTFNPNQTTEPIQTKPKPSQPGSEEAENLDAPPPTSKEAGKVEGEQIYVDAGKAKQSELEKWKQESVDIDETLGGMGGKILKDKETQDPSGAIPDRSGFNPQELADAASQQNLTQTGTISVEFEK